MFTLWLRIICCRLLLVLLIIRMLRHCLWRSAFVVFVLHTLGDADFLICRGEISSYYLYNCAAICYQAWRTK
uniref:Uncharacterized protein n=1 Tax=Ixodes scapularis TaxID=6945 RepID=A0A4D5S0Y1_IXOSC